MAQFTVKWPNGAEVTFEGDVSFADLQAFLDRAEPPAALRETTQARSENTHHRDNGGDGEEPLAVALDPARVQAQLDHVEARTDVERVTVMAWVAREAGAAGIDHDAAARIYRELGLPMPGNWRSTFSNAATRGYIVNEGRGIWRPTSPGENFARLGQRRPSAAARRRNRRAQPESLPLGGDGD
jgi:hypothetical protein